MRKHITLDSIDCKDLQYVTQGSCFVCLACFVELDDVDYCMNCRFSKLEKRERQEKERDLIEKRRNKKHTFGTSSSRTQR